MMPVKRQTYLSRQALQRGLDGVMRYRWRLSLPSGRRVITWAASLEEAERKCQVHRHVTPVLIVPMSSEEDA